MLLYFDELYSSHVYIVLSGLDLSHIPVAYLQNCEDSVQLVFSERDVSRDLPQHVDGL